MVDLAVPRFPPMTEISMIFLGFFPPFFGCLDKNKVLGRCPAVYTVVFTATQLCFVHALAESGKFFSM